MSSINTETETVIKRILPYLRRRGYDPEFHLDFETAVASTTRYSKGYVDILVTMGKVKPLSLIEAKRSSKRLNALDRDQALDYGRSLKVSFVVVTNGYEMQSYNVETGEAIKWDGKLVNRIPTATQLPFVLDSLRKNRGLTDIPLSADSTLPFRPGLPLKQLNALFARCHNAIRKIEKNEDHAFADFSKLLFLKLLEEKANNGTFTLPYSYRFHELADKTDSEADQVKGAIEQMIGDIKRKTAYGAVLDAPLWMKRPKTFQYIVRALSGVSFEDSGLDTKGAAFEYFVRATLKGKRLGQYFTPRPLVELMLTLVGRQLVTNTVLSGTEMKVLDPACGTGGFLVFTMKDGLAQLESRLRSKQLSQRAHDSAARRLVQDVFYGADANDGVAAAAKMNMIIAGDGHTNIAAEDTLRAASTVWNANLPDCDLILTNPPFGTSETESLTSSDLQQYPIRRSSKGQHLFLQKMVLCTRPGGTICTVIDEGVLNTESATSLRKWLLQQTEILAIVKLPEETFKPNKINVRSSVLYIRKRYEEDVDLEAAYPVAFCEVDSLGYHGSGEPIRGFDFRGLLASIEKDLLNHGSGSQRSGPHWTAFDVKSTVIATDRTTRFDLKYWEPGLLARIQKAASAGSLTIETANRIKTRRGKSPAADLYVDEADGYALVVKAGSNISEYGVLTPDGADFIEKNVYEESPDFAKLQKGDVLLASTGDDVVPEKSGRSKLE